MKTVNEVVLKKKDEMFLKMVEYIKTNQVSIVKACEHFNQKPAFYYDYRNRHGARLGVENVTKKTRLVTVPLPDKKPITVMIGDSDEIGRLLEKAGRLNG